MKTSSRLSILLIGVCTLLSSLAVYAERDNRTCGIIPGQPLTNGYGPYDFTNPSHQEKLPIVLSAHFRPNVERLIRGVTNTTVHGDLDYTLRAIPNYHRALYAASKLQQRELRQLKRGEQYKPRSYTAECWFTRAIYFQPKDATTRMLFAMHLQASNKQDEAEGMYEQALSLDGTHTELHYNAGLFYLSVNKIEKAKHHANIAYQQGYPLEGLKNKLQQLKNKK